ncbi:hypothetical protein AMATHDRAFT_3103 [Amanita thiersii Skay4041]|uniref:Uncharacterized protein n=1 Tax=Amanita thiersii Skay4041 TaxID=703135 RepID=A0A2A9NLM9_9AGAR|nr:hypothetical protein AMATHDRAFT_3103 [Amanita thiersii Skay4041]
MSYYPPPGSHQPVVYSSSHVPSEYYSPQLQPNVIYVPSHSRSSSSSPSRRHGRRHKHGHRHGHDHRHRDRDGRRHKHGRSHRQHHYHDDYDNPQIMTTIPVAQPSGPMSMAPSQHMYSGYHYRPSWVQRIRRFFGFAPTPVHYNYKSNSHSWGFLGRSPRQKYIDGYTGAEVDRHGRPVYRV